MRHRPYTAKTALAKSLAPRFTKKQEREHARAHIARIKKVREERNRAFNRSFAAWRAAANSVQRAINLVEDGTWSVDEAMVYLSSALYILQESRRKHGEMSRSVGRLGYYYERYLHKHAAVLK